jgi:hypothetical protein
LKDETLIELYDISNDQQETRNLAFDDGHKAKTKELLSALKAKMTETGDRLKLSDDLYEGFTKRYHKILD